MLRSKEVILIQHHPCWHSCTYVDVFFFIDVSFSPLWHSLFPYDLRRPCRFMSLCGSAQQLTTLVLELTIWRGVWMSICSSLTPAAATPVSTTGSLSSRAPAVNASVSQASREKPVRRPSEKVCLLLQVKAVEVQITLQETGVFLDIQQIHSEMSLPLQLFVALHHFRTIV